MMDELRQYKVLLRSFRSKGGIRFDRSTIFTDIRQFVDI